MAFTILEKNIRESEFNVAHKKLIYKSQERQIKTPELNIANRELRRAEEKQNEYIQGLEEMMFMTSYKVRQPIANMLDESINYSRRVETIGRLYKRICNCAGYFYQGIDDFYLRSWK